MLTPSGAKVLDFGIATPAGSADHRPDGMVVGTPAYLAPEQFDRQPATPAADMYAVGVLLYYCLTGRLPYAAGTTATELLGARWRITPEPLPPIAGLPAEVADLCQRCLDDDPGRRPSSLMAALELAEVVDARVYVPMLASVPRPRTAPVSPWTERAAAEATEAVALHDWTRTGPV